MIVTRIGCTENSATATVYHESFVDFEPDTTRPLAEQITAALAAHDWCEDDAGYHCPRHNPTMVGQRFNLEDEFGYLHLGNGVYARRHENNGGPRAQIEVQVRALPTEKED